MGDFSARNGNKAHCFYMRPFPISQYSMMNIYSREERRISPNPLNSVGRCVGESIVEERHTEICPGESFCPKPKTRASMDSFTAKFFGNSFSQSRFHSPPGISAPAFQKDAKFSSPMTSCGFRIGAGGPSVRAPAPSNRRRWSSKRVLGCELR